MFSLVKLSWKTHLLVFKAYMRFKYNLQMVSHVTKLVADTLSLFINSQQYIMNESYVK